MPNVMVALPNIGGALCSTPQSLADVSVAVHRQSDQQYEERQGGCVGWVAMRTH